MSCFFFVLTNLLLFFSYHSSFFLVVFFLYQEFGLVSDTTDCILSFVQTIMKVG